MIRIKYIITPLSVLIFILFLSDNLKAADNIVTKESGNENPATEALAEKLTIEPPLSEGQAIDNSSTLSPFERGVTEFNAENYEEALVLFEEAYKKIQTDPKITTNLGLTHREMQNFQEAAKFFKETMKLDQKAGDAGFLLANVLYSTREYEEALNVIDAARREGIRLPESNHLRGQILTKLKRNSEAVEAFNEAKSLDPALAQQADFQIALAYFNDKEFKKAEEVFNGFITSDPASDWALFAKEYLNAIEKIPQPYRLNLNAGVQYDDNVLAVPIDQSLIDIKKQGDWKKIFSILGEYTLYEDGPWNTKASYTLNIARSNKSVYLKDNGDTVPNQDTLIHTISIMPTYNTDKNITGALLSYSYLELDYTKYMETFGINPSYTILLKGNHLGQFYLKYKKQKQDIAYFINKLGNLPPKEENRDADNYSTGVGYVYTFPKGVGMLNVKIEGDINNAAGDNWDSSGIKASGGLLYPFWNNKIKANIFLDIYKQAFSNMHSAYGLRREDYTTTIQPSVTHSIRKSLDMNLGYTYIKSSSNIDVYRYVKNLYAVNLVYRF